MTPAASHFYQVSRSGKKHSDQSSQPILFAPPRAVHRYEDLRLLYELYMKRNLKNPACIVDTNHSNSGKQYMEQIRIAKEVLHSRRHSDDIRSLVKGLMIESYIEPGSQKIGEHCYGKSITDPCLGWDDTERLLYDIAELS